MSPRRAPEKKGPAGAARPGTDPPGPARAATTVKGAP